MLRTRSTIGTIIAALCFLAVAIGFFVAGPGQYTPGILICSAMFIFSVFVLWSTFQYRKWKGKSFDDIR
jgi:hypothetical protein